jgi:hypothetical protein
MRDFRNFLTEKPLTMSPHQDGGTIFHYFVQPEDVGHTKYSLERDTFLYDKKFNPLVELKKSERIRIMSMEPVVHNNTHYAYASTSDGNTKGFVVMRHIRKPTGSDKTKRFSERQERAVVTNINRAVRENLGNPITIVDKNGYKIKNVIGAKKPKSTSTLGKEPLTDMVITTKTGEINISMKGNTTPSIAGGGWKGLNAIDRDLTLRVVKAVISWYKRNGYKEGDKGAPDVYYRIPPKINKLLIIGNKEMGGPIHFMYIGDLEPDFEFDKTKKTLTLPDGEFVQSLEFAKESELYFRIRKRYADQTLTFKDKSETGLPWIFKAGKAGEENGSRISVSKYHPKTGNNTIELD